MEIRDLKKTRVNEKEGLESCMHEEMDKERK